MNVCVQSQNAFSCLFLVFLGCVNMFVHVLEFLSLSLSLCANKCVSVHVKISVCVCVSLALFSCAFNLITAPFWFLFSQIFKLMKFDSYARFVRSPLYQGCMVACVEGKALPSLGISSKGSRECITPTTNRKKVNTPKSRIAVHCMSMFV